MYQGQTMDDQSAEQVQRYRPLEQLIPAHWADQVVEANGIRQHYLRTGGDKPPLLMLQGFMEGALSWLRTAQALEADYGVVMLDARGHGLSERIGGPGFSQDLLNADVAALIRELDLAPVRVHGFSQGGITGIHVAADHPALVRSLVVEGWADDARGGGDLTDNPGYQAWLSAWTAWLEGLKTQTHAERMASSLSQRMPGAPLLPEIEYVPWVEDSARVDLDLVRMGAELWAGVAEKGRAMVEALTRVTCPALVLKSSMTFPQPGAPTSVAEEPSDQPNVRVLRFANTGHLIHREQFELFLSAVREFFAQT